MIASIARATTRLARFSATAASGAWRPMPPGPKEQAAYLHAEAGRIARVLHLDVESNRFPADAQLVVCNHVGYLDVIALASLGPSAFVSKSEVASWPGIGALARRAGTLFLDRGRRACLPGVADAIRARIDAGVPVVVFPEGTSSDGSSVLPFHPSLFEVAIRESWRVVPAAIAYELPDGGNPAESVAYWGDMTFLPHFLGLLSRRRVVARLRFGCVRVASGDRKLLARQLHAAVEGLHGVLSDSRPRPTAPAPAVPSRATA